MEKSRDYDSLSQKLARLFGSSADPSQTSNRLQRFLDAFKARGPGGPELDGRRELLATVLDGEIIPRLLAAHSHDDVAVRSAQQTRPGPGQITLDEVEHFADLCLASDPTLGYQFVHQLLERGLSREVILLELITESARDIGLRWVADRLNFAEVSLACVRKHEIVHQLQAHADEHPSQQSPTIHGRALLASAPSSRHILGPVIVAEFFRNAGWYTQTLLPDHPEVLLSRIRTEWFDAIGISVSIDKQLDGLKELVGSVRTQSKNPNACIFLGGPVFVLSPDHRPAEFDADAICIDPRITVTLAEISRLASH